MLRNFWWRWNFLTIFYWFKSCFHQEAISYMARNKAFPALWVSLNLSWQWNWPHTNTFEKLENNWSAENLLWRTVQPLFSHYFSFLVFSSAWLWNQHEYMRRQCLHSDVGKDVDTDTMLQCRTPGGIPLHALVVLKQIPSVWGCTGKLHYSC